MKKGTSRRTLWIASYILVIPRVFLLILLDIFNQPFITRTTQPIYYSLSFIFQYGLYSSLCGGFIYVIFGTIPELSIAPTALISLLTFSYTNNIGFDNIHAAILLCFLAGCVELLCGIAHLGKYINTFASLDFINCHNALIVVITDICGEIGHY